MLLAFNAVLVEAFNLVALIGVKVLEVVDLIGPFIVGWVSLILLIGPLGLFLVPLDHFRLNYLLLHFLRRAL